MEVRYSARRVAMLVEFSVENFRSIHERVTLSMLAATELDSSDALIGNTFAAPGELRLLKSVLIYGANASGKSNLVKAMSFARKFILESAKESQSGEAIEVTPFRLDPDAEHKESKFEFVWMDGNDRYRYRFAVNVARVIEEALYRSSADDDAEAEVYHRDVSGIYVDAGFREGMGIESKTRRNALFLSVMAAWNGEVSQKILEWFRNSIVIISGLQDRKLLDVTTQRIREGGSLEDMLHIIREADLGITSISAKEITPEMFPAGLSEFERRVLLTGNYETLTVNHQRFTAAGREAGEVEFSLNDESEGTKKFIALAAPLLDVFKHARTLVVDEFDARLHPRLSHAIVEAFHSASNPKNAQIIAVTHDTNLLDRNLVRRDQIWFTDKESRGATRLYSLAEFDLPADAHYQRDYLLGHYGAIPAIGNLVQSEVTE